MTLFEEKVNKYWKYYISLEKSFLDAQRYVEFDYLNNGSTYSMAFVQLFQAVCSEIDVVGKELANICDSSFKANERTGINQWWFYISSKHTDIQSIECRFIDNTCINPWDSYFVVKSGNKYVLDKAAHPEPCKPSWWDAYNGVKHRRTQVINGKSNFMSANLKNVVDSFAALYVLETIMLNEVFIHGQDREISMMSSLFDNNQEFYVHLLQID